MIKRIYIFACLFAVMFLPLFAFAMEMPFEELARFSHTKAAYYAGLGDHPRAFIYARRAAWMSELNDEYKNFAAYELKNAIDQFKRSILHIDEKALFAPAFLKVRREQIEKLEKALLGAKKDGFK